MRYDIRTHFKENEDDETRGFTIVDTNEANEEYLIVEMWEPKSEWLQYWTPETELRGRVSENKCEKQATLTREQFETVCSKIGYDPMVEETA